MSSPEVTAALLLMRWTATPRMWRSGSGGWGRFCRHRGRHPVLEAGDATEAERLWAARKVISPALFKMSPNKVSEDVAVPLGAIPALVAGLQEISRRRGLRTISYGHAGDGNIHVNIMFDQRRPGEREAVHHAVEDIFTLVGRLHGTLSGEHGIGLTKAPYLGMELSEASMALQRRLKQAFDPTTS